MLARSKLIVICMAWIACLIAARVTTAQIINAQACNPMLQCCVGTSNPSQPGCTSLVGNPIDVITGNKLQTETDLPALPGPLGIEVVRFYNSHSSGPKGNRGLVGRGWKLSYEHALVRQGNETFQLELANGSSEGLTKIKRQDKQMAWQGQAGRLDLIDSYANRSYRLVRPDFEVWEFDLNGRLRARQLPDGHRLELNYDVQGRLTTVTDPQGRQLSFEYSHASGQYQGVSKIITPVGDISFRFANSTATLESVTYPDSARRAYHHENTQWPTLLTGITVYGSAKRGSTNDNSALRIASWDYDGLGRAILSTRGDPTSALERVNLKYFGKQANGDGVTELTNSLGEVTRFQFKALAGQNRITEIVGPGCASCAPSNRRFKFTVTEGNVDAIRVSHLNAKPDSHSPIELKFDKQGKVIRQGNTSYKYDDKSQLVQVARPSIVPGHEHQKHFQYNEFRQITQIEETGFSQVNREGKTSEMPIRRTTRMHYATINGKSLLIGIDGPLANGPKNSPDDSDIYQFLWDVHGKYIVQQTMPRGFVSKFTHDAAGRLTQIENDLQQTTISTYAWQGQVTKRQQTGVGWAHAQHSTYAYDALGRLTEQSHARPEESSAFGWNLANQMVWQANHLGHITAMRYDTESRPLETSLNSSTMRLPEQLEKHFSSTAPIANSAVPLAAVSVQDDFGRTVSTTYVDSGTSLMFYDEADRLIAMQDAAKNRAVYQWTPDNRIALQTHVNAADSSEITTRWIYQGRQLIRLEHPDQTEDYQYNERGQRVERIVSIKGLEIPVVLRYAFDEQGRPQAHSLPDGSWIVNQRNGQQQITGLLRKPSNNTQLAWLTPSQSIVSAIESDLVGIRSYAMGNGLIQLAERNRQGQLTGTSVAKENPSTKDDVLLSRFYVWDTQLNLRKIREQTASSSGDHHFAYDKGNRLIAAELSDKSVYRYFYDAAGRRLLSQESGQTSAEDPNTAPTIKSNYVANTHQRGQEQSSQHLIKSSYNSVGQTTSLGAWQYKWNAAGYLTQASNSRQGASSHANYQYDHRGLRNRKSIGTTSVFYVYDETKRLIAEISPSGRTLQQYVYLGETPIALIVNNGQLHQSADGNKTPRIHQLWRDLFAIAEHLFEDSNSLTWLHSNHLGAPELATNRQGKVLWKAKYSPFGHASIQGNLGINLRLPGQYFDSETGLHYNRQRYYDTTRGSYLSPDPSGEPDGTNRYAYVRSNPINYIDPNGLILFAFDGTNNSNPPPGKDDFSNVYKFYQAYDQTKNGRAWYMNGVGRDDDFSGIKTNYLDEFDANTARIRVNFMLQQLDNHLSENLNARPTQRIYIDIVGFSRGAAMARDFSNRVSTLLSQSPYGINPSRCVELRFMGLWDTVAQFGLNGSANTSWQLAVPATVQNVFHAVAINENRFLFPGEAIARGTERGFIGSHADIGGSYGSGDLSDVALNWIYQQAVASGITMKKWGNDQTRAEWGAVTSPFLHDKSNGTENSSFCLRGNNQTTPINCTYRRQISVGGLTAAKTRDFIFNRSVIGIDADGTSPLVADVNMANYYQWLHASYGFSMPQQ